MLYLRPKERFELALTGHGITSGIQIKLTLVPGQLWYGTKNGNYWHIRRDKSGCMISVTDRALKRFFWEDKIENKK